MFDPARSRAVLIGTSRYDTDDELAALPAVRNNLDALDVTLTEDTLCGLPADRCVVVPDPENASAVGKALEEAGEAAEDLLLIYYAGHGLIDRRGELYLGLRGTDSRPGMLPYSGVPYSLIRESVRLSRASSRVVILDCCFSGRAIDAATGPDAVVAGQVEIQGAYTLTSSSRTSVSIAKESEEFTAFTGELLRVLRRGVPGGPELLNVDLLYDELRTGLIRTGMPEPQISRMQSIHHLGIARNAALGLPAPAPVAAAAQPPAPPPKKPKPAKRRDQPPKHESRLWGRLPFPALVIPVVIAALVAAVLAAPRVIQIPADSPDPKNVAPVLQPTPSTMTSPRSNDPPAGTQAPVAPSRAGNPGPGNPPKNTPIPDPDRSPTQQITTPPPDDENRPFIPATLPKFCGWTSSKLQEWAKSNGITVKEEAADPTEEVALSQSRAPGTKMERGESVTVRMGSSYKLDCG